MSALDGMMRNRSAEVSGPAGDRALWNDTIGLTAQQMNTYIQPLRSRRDLIASQHLDIGAESRGEHGVEFRVSGDPPVFRIVADQEVAQGVPID